MSAYSNRVIADGAVTLWRLNETSGTTAVDMIGGNNGTISGGVTLGQAGALSDGDKAFQYNGTSSAKVIVPTGAYQTFGTGPVTLECWVKLLGAAAAYSFVDAHNSVSASAGIAVFCDATNFTGRARDGTTSITTAFAQTAAAVADQAWRHVVLTFTRTPDTLTLFINGQQMVQNTGTIGSISSTTGTGLGCSSGGTLWYLNGALDDCAIYPTALTAAQIKAHYDAGLAEFAAGVPWWITNTFDEDGYMQSFNNWTPITPSDTVNLATLADAIWVGGGGNLAVVSQGGQVTIFTAVPAGSWLPIRARRINATNTTASNILALNSV